MGGDSICALADRLGESELGSGPRKTVRVRSNDGHNHRSHHELYR